MADSGMAVRALRPLGAWLTMQGIDARSIFGGRGLEPGALWEPGLRVPRENWLGVWADAAEVAREPDLGLLVGELTARLLGAAMPPEDHIAALAIATGPTVGEGLALAGRAHRVTTPGLWLDVVAERDGRRKVFVVSPPDPPRPAIDFLLSWPLLAARSVATAQFAPLSVVVPYPAPARLEVHRRLFGERTTFGAAGAAYWIAPEDWRLPTGSGDAAKHQALLHHVEEASTADPVARVRALLLETHPAMEAEEAAKRLGMSPRTLRRVLLDADTSYRRVVDEVRRARGEQLLREGRPLTEVASLLGYSDERALRRAMKRWPRDE